MIEISASLVGRFAIKLPSVNGGRGAKQFSLLRSLVWQPVGSVSMAGLGNVLTADGRVE
jgi:hypothetical protein